MKNTLKMPRCNLHYVAVIRSMRMQFHHLQSIHKSHPTKFVSSKYTETRRAKGISTLSFKKQTIKPQVFLNVTYQGQIKNKNKNHNSKK